MTDHAAIRFFERWKEAADTSYEDILKIIGQSISMPMIQREEIFKLHDVGMTSFPIEIASTPLIGICTLSMNQYMEGMTSLRTFLHRDQLSDADLALANALTYWHGYLDGRGSLNEHELCDLFESADQARWARPPTIEERQVRRKFRALAEAHAV